MRVEWAALLSSAGILLGSASVAAQGPVPLSGMQLDSVIPAYQLDPIQYQLRVAVDAIAVTEPDQARHTLLVDDAEAQRIPGEEPEERCTPARRALLAAAGRSESSAWQATPERSGASMGRSSTSRPWPTTSSPASGRRFRRP